MNLRQIAGFGLGALAVASWFSAASTPDVRPSLPAVERSAASRDLEQSAAVMQAEVARLHTRLAPSTTPVRSRDLFHFAVRTPRAASRTIDAAPVAAVIAPVEPAVPAKPALQLIGVAEDTSADGVVRTAIVSGLGDVFLVKAGDTIAGRFRVEQVSTDAVQLTETATAASTTLTLR